MGRAGMAAVFVCGAAVRGLFAVPVLLGKEGSGFLAGGFLLQPCRSAERSGIGANPAGSLAALVGMGVMDLRDTVVMPKL